MKKLLLILSFIVPLTVFGQVTAKYNLSWAANSEPDMASYRVYLAVGADGPWKLVATIEHPIVECAILSSATGLHRFRIGAVNSYGLESEPSIEASAMAPVPPAIVTSVRIKSITVEQTTTIQVP